MEGYRKIPEEALNWGACLALTSGVRGTKPAEPVFGGSSRGSSSVFKWFRVSPSGVRVLALRLGRNHCFNTPQELKSRAGSGGPGDPEGS